MQELFNLGINEKEIIDIIEICPMIKDLEKNEIADKINILDYINCSVQMKKNIITSNPFYLNRTNEEILKLVKLLNKLGFNNLNILFDSNPYILNLDLFQIENYVNCELKKGNLLEDIVDELQSKPYLFQEL